VPAFYVDGAPKVYLKDANNDGRIVKADGDKAILIGGLRRGGQHYFALDVTDPENPEVPSGWANWGIWDSDTVWRSTGMIGPDMTTDSSDYATASYPYLEMGQTWSTPVIEAINDGGTPKPVAFIGAGYDQNQDGAAPPADTMGRGIYAIDIMDGGLLWTYTNAENSTMSDSVPSRVATLDTTGSGTVDRLYVGDTGGKLSTGSSSIPPM
jgi:type IV pilus assembly protein PilY1